MALILRNRIRSSKIFISHFLYKMQMDTMYEDYYQSWFPASPSPRWFNTKEINTFLADFLSLTAQPGRHKRIRIWKVRVNDWVSPIFFAEIKFAGAYNQPSPDAYHYQPHEYFPGEPLRIGKSIYFEEYMTESSP